MKTLCLVLALFCLAAEASAKTVYCTNCSTKMTQAVEKATSVEQLRMLLREYDESIQQTAAQLQMVQQNIDQYANMVQNTAALPASVIQRIACELSRFGKITNALNTIRNDVAGLGKIFDALYQTQDELKRSEEHTSELQSQR